MKTTLIVIILLIAYCLSSPFEAPDEIKIINSSRQSRITIDSAEIDGQSITSNDWILAYSASKCVGKLKWGYANKMILMGNDGSDALKDYPLEGEKIHFKIFDAAAGEYLHALTASPIKFSVANEYRIQALTADCNRQGEIFGTVYNDLNGNGVRDWDYTNQPWFGGLPWLEPGLANWTVQLQWPLGNVIEVMTTSSIGYSSSIQVPPEVWICEVLQTGWTQTEPNNDNGCLYVTQDEWWNPSGFNFGNNDGSLVCPIQGYKWNDVNNNGVWDNNENGVPGVIVEAHQPGSNELVYSTTTNTEGEYCFETLPVDPASCSGFEQGYGPYDISDPCYQWILLDELTACCDQPWGYYCDWAYTWNCPLREEGTGGFVSDTIPEKPDLPIDDESISRFSLYLNLDIVEIPPPNSVQTYPPTGYYQWTVSDAGQNLNFGNNMGCINDGDCDDGLFCNGSETCTNGNCVSSGLPCSPPTSLCNEETDTCVECNVNDDCLDPDYCTTDQCVDGSCTHTPVNCDDQNACTTDSCDDLGACTHVPIVCDDQNPCTDNYCDPMMGCYFYPIDCDDGLFCNGEEVCTDGICGPGSPPCGDYPCFELQHSCGSCNNDADCSDGIFCNGAEMCFDGLCTDPGDPCPGQLCDETLQSCVDCLTNADCDNNFACDQDICSEGVCSHPALVCEDLDPCTEDHCDPGAGCIFTPIICDDGIYCDGLETCVDGVCEDGDPPCGGGMICDEINDICTFCTSDEQCDNGIYCDGIEICLPLVGLCVNTGPPCTGQYCSETDGCLACLSNADCDDGLFCDGTETCVNGNCSNPDPPCLANLCNEATDTCVDCQFDSDCDDGQFCNGAELCNDGTCGSGTPPCNENESCNESLDICQCANDSACDDGDPCTTDSCDGQGNCVNTSLECDDGLFCNGIETCINGNCSNPDPPCPELLCDELMDVCQPCLNDGDCDNGLFCDSEACVNGNCQFAGYPCPYYCDEVNDVCIECQSNTDCDDGLFCNGSEYCENGACYGGNPDCPPGLCNEDTDTCEACTSDAQCNDNQFCNGTEYCVSGYCTIGSPPCDAAHCEETNDYCLDCISNEECDDGLFCTADICVTGVCYNENNVCPGQICDELHDSCVDCMSDADCDDGNACNGGETCQESTCVAGQPVECIGQQVCDPNSGDCVDCLSDADCDDGLFCDGTENCFIGECFYPDPPCPANLCNEADDTCTACTSNEQCTDGEFCNGEEHCYNGECQNGFPPCEWHIGCDEINDHCIFCETDDDCYDLDACNGVETCQQGQCVNGQPLECPGQICDTDLGCIDCLNDSDCNDNKLCTDDYCQSETNECYYVLNCNDYVNCTIDSCDEDGLCDYSLMDCNDYDPCTFDDCFNGNCYHSSIDCDDGQFCNGLETCDGVDGCIAGVPPCAADDICDEVTDTCNSQQPGDASGDGVINISDVVQIVADILTGADYYAAADANEDGYIDINDIVLVVCWILQCDLSGRSDVITQAALIEDRTTLGLQVEGETAGLQLSFSDGFQIINTLLPEGWVLHQSGGRLLIFSMDGSSITGYHDLFQFRGDLHLQSSRIVSWSGSQVSADFIEYPTGFALYDAVPNPFNPKTTISYAIPGRLKVSLKIYNSLGKEVAVLVNGEQSAGEYSRVWDGAEQPTGIYFVKLSAGSFVSQQKLMLVK